MRTRTSWRNQDKLFRAIGRELAMQAKPELKSVEWSHPTSPNAARFGFRDGCWTVKVGRRGSPYKAVAAFAKDQKDAAIEYADGLPQAWCPCWLQFNTPPEPATI